MKRSKACTLALPKLKDLEKISKFDQPKEFQYFSFDSARQQIMRSRASLGVLIHPKLPLDLNAGYPTDYIMRDPKPERLQPLLKALESETLDLKGFITWRGIMTKIITTPYFPEERWELGATLKGSTIYLEEHESEEKQASKFGGDAKQKLFSYYGYKAETLLTSRNDESDAVTDTNVQFCSVYKTKLAGHSLILGAEVDCILKKPEKEEDITKHYCEIKTNMILGNDRQKSNFVRFKGLKVWAQSFLAGVRSILFAFRDHKGLIQEVKMYQTAEFPRMARASKAWDPNCCLTFGAKVLDFIAANVTLDNADFVYTIAYDPLYKEISISEPENNSSLKFVI
jgi:RAT1-interacting protein